MKIALKNQSKEKKNSDQCSVTEYPLNDAQLDMAISHIEGRYPEQGRIVNRECQELAYVQEGSGKIVINGEEISLAEGDSIIIDAGEAYYWEGNLHLFISCRPAWTVEQYQKID